MSKLHRSFLLVIGAAVCVLQWTSVAGAQDLTATITIRPGSPSVAVVEGKFAAHAVQRELHFLDSFGSVSGLARRISNVRMIGSTGKSINVPKGESGRYTANEDIATWSYSVDISPLKDRFAAAHTTWSNSEGGVIVPDDILPQSNGIGRSAKLAFNLPENWAVSTSERAVQTRVYEVTDLEKAVFYASSANRTRTIRTGGAEIVLSISGKWHFTDDEAAEMAASVMSEYERIFGSVPAKKVSIAIMAFPDQVPTGHWEAGSRGSSITIVSSDTPFKSQSLQRLHEQFRHEIFHIWIPNGIKLTGNYDWFYEGFALYQSLKVGVAVNRIRFDDMLETLSRAYDIGGARSEASLIELSRRRWMGANTQIYARGMLVAFLCDLALLEASRGKKSVENVSRKIFERHRSGPPQNANEAILEIIRSHSELRPLIDRYITAGGPFEWRSFLRSAGLEAVTKDQLTRLKVVDAPSGRQKQILEKLGYNNWRKLSGSRR